MLMFNRWDTTEVQVQDPGLKAYINLAPVLVPQTFGRNIRKQFWKSKKPIVERLINKLMVTGHKGKKHFRTSGRNTGKVQLTTKVVKETFEVIETKTKTNPIQILIKAIENGAPAVGIASIEYGGVRYSKAVDMSPQRRIDLALRWLTQGAYHSSAASRGKKNIVQAWAEELMNAANNDPLSKSVKKKTELERQAQASR